MSLTQIRSHFRRFGIFADTLVSYTAAAALLAGVAACSGRLTDVPPPSNLIDPTQVQTPESAVGMYTGTLYQFSLAFAGDIGVNDGNYAAVSGLFADEYTTTNGSIQGYYDTHTATPLQENNVGPYEQLHGVRILADQAIANLSNFPTEEPASYRGELHAIKGFIYVFFSELYCSGVPFSYLVNGGNIVYGQAESTTQMLTDAIAQFDSATALSTDSVRIQYLAAIGKGRALLDMGNFNDAKTAVAGVPTSYTYKMGYSLPTYPNYFAAATATSTFPQVTIFMSDREGGNGLAYVSSPDPRVAHIAVNGRPLPAKFSTGDAPVTLASGIEARLIEAEADLNGGQISAWTDALNHLRDSAAATPIADLTADSTTSASDSLRVNVMFHERAFWMFGTGHRAGDMRRLIRQYGRQVQNVFPVGLQPYLYYALAYGTAANLEPPKSEYDDNPQFHGCINRDA